MGGGQELVENGTDKLVENIIRDTRYEEEVETAL